MGQKPEEAPPHVLRMVEEIEALGTSLSKLRMFISGPVYAELAADSQSLLTAQEQAMSCYYTILNARIRSERLR